MFLAPICLSISLCLVFPQPVRAILIGLHLTSLPFFSSPHSLYYVSISLSYNCVPLFSNQGHFFPLFCSSLLLIIPSKAASAPSSLPPTFLSILVLYFASYITTSFLLLLLPLFLPPCETVNLPLVFFLYASNGRNRRANSLKYTWKSGTHSHASLMFLFATTHCIMHV